MAYNGYYKVMSNIPKMGQLPTPVQGLEMCPNIHVVECALFLFFGSWMFNQIRWRGYSLVI